jgi:rod shape-determining protein MreC
MDSFFSRFKNPLTLIVIVLLQVIALAVQVQRPTENATSGGAPDGPRITLLRRWSTALVTPLERLAHGSSMGVRGLWSNYIDLRHTRQANQDLRQEVRRLREEQAAFAEDAAQGRRLQALLAFKQKYIATTVAAQIIGTSGVDRSRVVYLDKGSADGLKPEQAVITPDGVVGKLRDVFPHTAQVLLISDSTSGAGVILADSRIRGILRGTATGQVQINNLTADSRIQVGEKVVTSGGDLVFPRGLPVGTIERIAPDPLHQPYTAITIKPAANLDRLEEVLVITGTDSTLPPAAQADAASAQTTAEAEAKAAAIAEENRRAADLVAERLPSLHDATDPAAAKDGATTAPLPEVVGGLPGIPNSGLPKQRLPVRTDRYTPGATPPAEELKPGAKTVVVPAVTPAAPAAVPPETPPQEQ